MSSTLDFARDMTVPLGTWTGSGKSRLSIVSYANSDTQEKVSSGRPKPKMSKAVVINPEFLNNMEITITTRES
jgi:hypothetical protein